MRSGGFLLEGDNDPRWSYVDRCGYRMCVAELERRVRKKSRPWFRRWYVTVMDNWTPARTFWTERGARLFAAQSTVSHIWRWQLDRWIAIPKSKS